MAQTINTNVASLNAQRNLNSSQGSLATSLQRLSSGLRINSAKDDAAGLAISERFNTQIRGLNQAVRNANDGISLTQTAEGALSEIGNNLQRIRELAVQSRNATNSNEDRAALQKEVSQLKSEIDRVVTTTKFNGTTLLDGTFTDKSFQVGANQGETINIASIQNASTTALGTWTSAAAVASTSGSSGVFTSATSDTDGQNFKLTVGGVDVLDVTQAGGVVETVDAARIDAALADSTTASALATAGITFTGTAVGGDLSFSKTDGTSFTVAVANTFDNPAGGFANATEFVGTFNNGKAAGSSMTGFAELNISTPEGADNALVAMDAALTAINNSRADLGAIQNRFSSVIANLQTTSENLSASRGRIVDADFATETANLTRSQILQQAGTAMLAQANGLPQNVLSLLRG